MPLYGCPTCGGLPPPRCPPRSRPTRWVRPPARGSSSSSRSSTCPLSGRAHRSPTLRRRVCCLFRAAARGVRVRTRRGTARVEAPPTRGGVHDVESVPTHGLQTLLADYPLKAVVLVDDLDHRPVLVQQRCQPDRAAPMDDRVGDELAGQQPGILQLSRVEFSPEPRHHYTARDLRRLLRCWQSKVKLRANHHQPRVISTCPRRTTERRPASETTAAGRLGLRARPGRSRPAARRRSSSAGRRASSARTNASNPSRGVTAPTPLRGWVTQVDSAGTTKRTATGPPAPRRSAPAPSRPIRPGRPPTPRRPRAWQPPHHADDLAKTQPYRPVRAAAARATASRPSLTSQPGLSPSGDSSDTRPHDSPTVEMRPRWRASARRSSRPQRGETYRYSTVTRLASSPDGVAKEQSFAALGAAAL